MSPRFALPLLAFLGAASALAGTKLLRFPDIRGDRVVFVHGGDLWIAPASGGTAARLTAHPGLELFPKFSPDGRWIAFTGQYDGDEQVYVIPAGGGEPRQLTFYPARGPLPDRWGFDHQVQGWSPDSKRVLFRSTREFWGPKDGRLYTVAIDGGLPTAAPMPVSGAGAFSPDGAAFVYSPLFRDFRAWKRYQGGWAQDLYVFYPGTNETRRIAEHPRTERDPMWIGDSIYFASDRTGTLNLYRFDLKGGKTTQLTRFDKWDARWPSSDGERRIVFELDGELQVFDIRSGKSTPIEIAVPNDGVHSRPRRVSVSGLIEDAELSPKGERALFVARGDIFTAPIEKGPTRNLTATSNAHERLARWSPDGRSIAYVSDATGEEQIWMVDPLAAQPPRRLTDGSRGRLHAPEWSPDSKRIAFGDSEGRVWDLEVASGAAREVARDTRGAVTRYVWSPDSAWLAFALRASERARALHVWSASEGVARRVTDGFFDVHSPAWDPAGEYLFHLSDRDFAPQISAVEWNYAGDRMAGVFALALRKAVAHPFPPESDEAAVAAEEKAAETKTNAAASVVAIDFDGLAERVARAPIEADNYQGLAATKGRLVLLRGTPFYYGRPAATRPAVQVFDRKERKIETVAEAGGFALSADGEKLLAGSGANWAVYDAKLKGKDSKRDVSVRGLQADIDPKAEWRTIFDEVWRRYRDFFYAPNMHGYNWAALGAQYRPWLDHAQHRWDVNYAIGEMIAELNVGHAYIWGGDYQTPERPRVALPGAEFALDEASGRYRLARILRGHNEEHAYRAPLTEIGVDAREGDFVLEIDGQELRAPENPYRLLRHKADRPVALKLAASADGADAREVRFNPLTDESNLRYLAWVSANRRKVDEATGGEVGYLHIPDMSAQGIQEWIKYFYPQLRKKGLVVDVRGNGGGNVSQMILGRLERKLLGTRFDRHNSEASTYPETVFHGHLVCLISENSASDGDIFPARFRKAGLGPLIGKRTWGGVIGIRNHGPLLDGGSVAVPEFSTNDVDGSYIIENEGVSPDIEVENDPAAAIAGRDPQLERGIEELLRRIREDPRELPRRPPDPVKAK